MIQLGAIVAKIMERLASAMRTRPDPRSGLGSISNGGEHGRSQRIWQLYAERRVEMPAFPEWDELSTELRAALIALYFAETRDALAGK